MAASASFQELQRRGLCVNAAALCETMDLIALILPERRIAVHRSFTWVKVFHLSSAELAYSPTALCFSKDGRRLLVGFEDGSITSYLLEQQDDESFQQRNIILERDEKEKELCRRRYLYSLDSRIFAGEEEDERDLLPHLAVASSLSFSSSSSVIITLNQANVLQIFSANLFPLLALSFPEFYRSIRFIGMEKSNILCESIGSDAHILLSTPLTALSKLPTLNSITALLFSIGTDLKELRNIVAGNLRKWKDALKPIIPKIMLMQSTLAGYDLRLDPIAFYFSVAMAGLWHPAAKVVFSSQWNEQNLNRLRASVEGAGRSLLHSLVITCARIATNINLKCRDLLLLAADVKGVNDLPSHLLPQLILYANQLLFKLDDTIQEAKLALERMLLFLQFIRETMKEASEVSSPAEESKITFSLDNKKKYAALFDPRLQRCTMPASRFDMSTSAESLTGTFLFMFLQDGADIPKDHDKLRLRRCNDNHLRMMGILKEDDWEEILELALAPSGINDGNAMNSTISLASLIKAMEASCVALGPFFQVTYPERKPDPLTEDTITLSDPSALSTYLSMGKSGEILPAIEISISGLGRQRLYSQILSSLESSSILAASIVFEGLKTLVALDVEVYSFADKSVGLIIVGTIGMDYYLIKTTLEASVFADVNIDPHSSGASANAKSASRAFPFQATKPSVISHNAYSSRPLRITSYHKMQVCGARGVVLVLDNDGGAILLDVENNDEVEEEDGVVMDEDDEGGE